MTDSFKDLFSQQSGDYQKYRPTYPQELFVYLASLCPRHDVALDCGTGNGQAALALSEFFNEVIAADPSAKQIEKASPHAKVRYVVAPAEKLPVPDHSVDLLTVAQAFHWFRHLEFFQEAQRVLKPQGILAVWVYDLCHISPEVDSVLESFYNGLLGSYWEPERKLLEQNFESVDFPFVEIPAPAFAMQKEWSLEDLTGYLSTWSALQSYRRKNTDPLPEYRAKLAAVWGEEPTCRVVWEIKPRVFSAALKAGS
jgi:SAM-dependent methyltransferase